MKRKRYQAITSVLVISQQVQTLPFFRAAFWFSQCGSIAKAKEMPSFSDCVAHSVFKTAFTYPYTTSPVPER